MRFKRVKNCVKNDLKGILINGQFPGPTLNVVTNDNVIVTVINKLDDPLLITWNGVKQRKSSWQDGVVGTNCPIPPNSQWTYKMQMKVQIGTFTYFPSTLMHRAADGFGGINILARSVIPIPYPKPFEQFTLLVSDWWKTDNKVLQQILDQGQDFPFPDALHINGRPNSLKFTGMKGYAYLFRVSNVGLTASINVRIQGHTLKLVEVEGSHTMQEVYESLDIHVGQSMAFLVTLHANPKDNIVASTRFTKPILTVTAILHYQGSNIPASKPLPVGPTYQPNKIKDNPPHGPMVLDTSVFNFTLHDFVEIVFQNNENVTTFSLITLMAMIFGLSVWFWPVEHKNEEKVQSSRCHNQKYNSGVSKFMECNIGCIGQQRDVEFKVSDMAKTILRTGNIFQSVE
ncbi:putative dof zinc finger protein DOF5.1-like [Capsicum annuum]|nr:putative dof zinc finger protein DOF5.1-like [Capsicum annuum]KAF3648421.1 putative dof zinc finger protein DOF5.1-like [Capsicum annuum]